MVYQGHGLILQMFRLSLGGLIGLSLNLDLGIASTFILEPKTQPSPETKAEIRIIFPTWEPLIPPLGEPTPYLPNPSLSLGDFSIPNQYLEQFTELKLIKMKGSSL